MYDFSHKHELVSSDPPNIFGPYAAILQITLALDCS